MDRCVRCGAELGVGRFCLNCGHRIGEPAPGPPPAPAPDPEPASAGPDTQDEPTALPVQAADPTPLPPSPVAAATSTPEWDPREDLLPYVEADQLEGEAPLRGKAWIGWVLGAVLLVGLVLVLLRMFASDGIDGDATATETPSSGQESSPGNDATASDGSEAPNGVGKRRNLARGASFAVPDTAPPTTDLDGTLVGYEAAQMHDGNPATAWRTAGDATGETIRITLAEPSVVSRVGLVNGYAKRVSGVDWYPNNRRILAVTWEFADGTTVEQAFAERRRRQMLKVAPVQTDTVTITITSVTPPGFGPLGRDYTAISEVALIGRRAG